MHIKKERWKKLSIFVLLVFFVIAAVTGKPHLEQMGFVEPITLILLWLAGQR